MASIKMDNLGKVYTGNVRAVSDVNIDIADGEMIVLVGPSGWENPRFCAWSQVWKPSPKARSRSATRW